MTVRGDDSHPHMGEVGVPDCLGPEATSDVSNHEHKTIDVLEEAEKLALPRCKGLYGEGPEFDMVESDYFLAKGNIFAYDLGGTIRRVYDTYRLELMELRPNPPIPETEFSIEGERFIFDYDYKLSRISKEERYAAKVYSTLADACQAVDLHNAPTFPTLMHSMQGLHGRIQDPTPSPNVRDFNVYHPSNEHEPALMSNPVTAIQPLWLTIGRTPSREEIESYIQFVKLQRRNLESGEGPSLMCPLSECKLDRELRRPQALRDHLFSHYKINPFMCTRTGCDKDFVTRANQERHSKKCSLSTPAIGSSRNHYA